LAGAGVAVGVMSEILVSSITEASESLGLSPFFVGVIVVAVVGNAAEHWVAVYFALKNKIGLAVNIAVGSAAQIALFVAPVLVLASFVIGPFPMALVFQRVRDRRDLPRDPHCGRDHSTRSVHVVRRSATARHKCGAGADVLLRVVAPNLVARTRTVGAGPSRVGHRSRHRRIDRERVRKIVYGQLRFDGHRDRMNQLARSRSDNNTSDDNPRTWPA
jgi:hypothetical protein